MVSFIIVNYNTSELVAKCVESVRRYCAVEPFEIIVVDNASRPEEQQKLKEFSADDCHLVMSRFNAGFGLGNMLGVNAAKGDFLCFINSDAYLVEDCIHPLCEYLREHADVGCVTPQQVNGKNKPIPTFNHCLGLGTLFLPYGFFETIWPKKYPSRKDFSRTEPFAVGEIAGSFMLFKADVFMEIGGFDVNLFLYREEYDLGMKLAKHHYKCVVCPQYTYIHAVGESTKSHRSLSVAERKVSKIYTYCKYHGVLKSLCYKFLLILMQVVFNPKRWYQLPILLSPSPMSKSMRHKA